MWWLAALATYVAILIFLFFLNSREFKRCPEKCERYRKLPVIYKSACWFAVVPLFVASIFIHPALGLLALLAFAVLEALCVRWYRKQGLLMW